MLLCFYMMVSLVVFMVVVSFFTKPHYELVQLVDQTDQKVIDQTKTSFAVKLMWVCIAVTMIIIYFIFN